VKYYKVLNEYGGACHGGSGKWLLPDGDTPGGWMPRIKQVIPCKRGYHLCRRGDLVVWLGPTIYLAEGRGEKVVGDDKVVFAEARLIRKFNTWDDRTKRLFAADCAFHVLHFYEERHPKDDRPRKAIEAVRQFANGLISRQQLSAARAAARVAAWDAEGAARAAEREWQTRRLFEYLNGKTKFSDALI